MHINVRRFSTHSPSDSVSYLVNVDKRDGKNNEYVVEITRLDESMYCVFDDVWSEEYLRNCCWMVSFYTLDALFSLGSSGRFDPDKRMVFSRRELEQLLVEGIGLAIGSFLREQASASLIAVAVRQALGHLYDNLLQRYAVKKGFYYHRTWVQEAVYVIEKKGKTSGGKPDSRSPQPGRGCQYSEGDYAIECGQNA